MGATLLIMAAGMGSRYGGNKQVDGLGPNGEILMEYSIYDAIRAGFDKVVFVIKPGMKETLASICGDRIAKKVKVDYAFQDFSSVPSFYHIPEERTKPFGTVHAVLVARDYIDQPFAVINADDYYGVSAFSTIYEKLQTLAPEGEATMVGYQLQNTVSKNGTVSRGVCHAVNGNLDKVVETLKIKLCENGEIRDIGAGMAPFNAYLSNLGVETLALRMERHSSNALALAEFLENHPKVSWVNYPGLKSSSQHELAKKYLPRGCSGVLCFGVKGGKAAGEIVMNSLKLAAIVVHVADTRTGVLHPASMTHRQLTDAELEAAGVSPDMIRVSVGIENIDDIKADFDQALNRA